MMIERSSHVSVRHPQYRGHGNAAISLRAVLARVGRILLGVHDRNHKSGSRDGSVAHPALAHHRCDGPSPGGARGRRRRQAAGAQAGRIVYTSGVPLPTPSGFMTGTYGMASADGEAFDIAIPTFSLDSPDSQRTIN